MWSDSFRWVSRTLLVTAACALAVYVPAFADEPSSREAALEGRVTSAGGEPVAGALVMAVPAERGDGIDAEPVRVRSGEDGTFRLGGCGQPPLLVRAYAPGFVPWADRVEETGEPLDVELTQGHVVRGRVLSRESGAPVAGAVVRPAGSVLGGRVTASVRRELEPTAQTDSAGRFVLTDLWPGAAAIAVEAPGYASARQTVSTFPPGAAEGAAAGGVYVYLEDGTLISGVVVDAEGQAIAGAHVRVFPAGGVGGMLRGGGGRRWREAVETSTRSGADGSFRLPGAPLTEAYTLVATHDEFAPARREGLRPSAGGTIEGVEIEMTRGGAVSVELVDAEGNPVTDRASIGVRCGGGPRGRRQWLGALVASRGKDELRREGNALVAERLPVATCAVTISVDGYDEVVVRDVRIEAGRTRPLGQRVLNVGPSIRGTLLDTSGEPVAGARVTAQGFAESGVSRRTAESREDGSFHLAGLTEGVEYDVTVTAEGFGALEQEGVLPDAGSLRLELLPAASVRGCVRNLATGAPVTRFSVQAMPTELGGEAFAPRSLVRRMGLETHPFTRTDGCFTLEGVSAGSYKLRVTAPGFLEAFVGGLELPAGQLTEIDEVMLDPGALVQGTVLDGETGKPVAGAELDVDEGGPLSQVRRMIEESEPLAVTGPEGRFTAEGLPSGPVTLEVKHPLYADAKVALDLSPGAPPEPATIELGQGGSIEGVVLGDDGAPLAGAMVTAMSGATFGPQGLESQTATDDLGAYRIEHIRPGTVRLMVMKLPGEGEGGRAAVMRNMQMQTVEVEEGATAVVNFPKVEGMLSVAGRVLRGSGEPFEGVLSWVPQGVRRGGAGMSLATAQAGPDGSFRVNLGAPGRYTVMAFAAGDGQRPGERFVIETVVEDQPSGELVLRIPETTIRGTVTDGQTGQPLRNVNVVARPREAAGGRRGNFVQTGDDGSYRFEGLAPGRYDLVFDKRGYALDVIEELDLDASDELEEVDQALLPAEAIDLTVEGDDGRPVSDAWIYTAGSDGIGGQMLGMTWVDGRATIDQLPPGSHDILVWATGWAPGVTAVNVPPLDGDAVHVRLVRGLPVEVHVFDVGQAPVEGAAVSVELDDGPDITGVLSLAADGDNGSLTTDGAGRAVIPGLAPGEYVVTVSLGELESSKSVKVREGEENAVEIDLR